MNAFDQCCLLEARTWAKLEPVIGHWSGGRFVRTDKGTLARCLQLTAGDVLMNNVRGEMVALEVKAEVRYTGRLFLEIWSNRNLSDCASHAMRGMNPGWLVHCRADWLLYYFESNDTLFVIDMFALKRWAFGYDRQRGHIFSSKYDEVVQRKHAQPNETVGRLVPIDDLREALKRGIRTRKLSELVALATKGQAL